MSRTGEFQAAIFAMAASPSLFAAEAKEVPWYNVCREAHGRELLVTSDDGSVVSGYCVAIDANDLAVHTQDRGVVKVAGDDARRFLNGLVTGDLAKVAAGKPCFAALLTPQGRLRWDLFLFGEDEGVALDAPAALEAGLIFSAPDDIDWDDEVRMAIEARAAFSPDALTGMEANLRFAGPETMETKIFGRLTAWQNWIFQRPNAVGEKGALMTYGREGRPHFDFKRT